ncbi:MAG: DUF6178 family protein [Pseudomonadota bacterium]
MESSHGMDPFGLVVHDEEAFLSKVVNSGMEQGIFTRDRADEIIRVSVAMANKYVLAKEIDFRSIEELEKVQATIIKLIGVGLEIKSAGGVEDGIRALMSSSPVDLFRLSYTRIEKLRSRWMSLPGDHKVRLLVSAEQYGALSEIAMHRLADFSVFSETELMTIGDLKLDDVLFDSVAVLEYYESECDRFEFILKCKQVLPFDLLNRSSFVEAESLSEVDALREALCNTLIISGFLDSPDPVSVTMADVRTFLAAVELMDFAEGIPDDIEQVLLDLIHELAEDLNERDAQLMTKECIRIVQKLLETVMNEWSTVTSPSENVFYKRWSRLVILQDRPDPISRIIDSDEPLDEFDFEMLVEGIAGRLQDEALGLITRLPWERLVSAQVLRLFQEFPMYHEALAESASIKSLNALELVELLEILPEQVILGLLPKVTRVVSEGEYTLDDLRLILDLPRKEVWSLIRCAGPPRDYPVEQMIRDYADAPEKVRTIFLVTGWGTDPFPELFREAWNSNRDHVKKVLKNFPPSEIGPFLESAGGPTRPEVLSTDEKNPKMHSDVKEINELFKSLPITKKRAATRYFKKPA